MAPPLPGSAVNTTSASSTDDLGLLTLQRRWSPDPDSPPRPDERLLGVRVVQAASSLDVSRLPGSTLPDDVLADVDDLLRASSGTPLATDALVAVVRRASLDGSVPRLDGGPVFVFDATPAARAPLVGVDIVTSESPPPTIPCPSSWEPAEWGELLRGDLGPWAAAVAHGELVALCHTPKAMFPVAAECGVWTDPTQRRQGLGAATTAAWAHLLAGRVRHRFYSHDHRNDASAAVARSLGLRHIGWEWTVSAEPWPEGDAWGNALLDHLHGRWTPVPELEVRNGGAGDAMHPEWFFRGFDEWDGWDRELLAHARQGPALDLGAGAGRASLWLQAQGIDVTAVDSSPGAVAVCRARGVTDARVGDLLDPPTDRPWRLILLLCGNLGLGGTFDGNRRLLRRLAEVAAPDALLVGDTVDPGGPSEIGLRIRYRGSATPWWRQCNVPVDEIEALVEGTGWSIERHVVSLPDHAVLLRRSSPPT